MSPVTQPVLPTCASVSSPRLCLPGSWGVVLGRRQNCLGEVYIHRWHAYHNQYAINSTKRHRPGADCQRSGGPALKAVGDLRLGDGIGRGKKSAAEGASHASSYSAMEDKLEVPPRVNRGDRLISSQAEHSLQWLCTRWPAGRAHPPLFR